MGSRIGLDEVANRKFSSPCWDRTQVVQPVA